MTFCMVKQQYPSAVETDWHQHPNGGGWVANSATVPEIVTVPESAVIGDHARIGDRANIGDGVVIGNRANIGDGAVIGDHAVIGYGASIGYCASIGNGASIGNDAVIGNDASIGDGVVIGNRASIGDGYMGDVLYICTTPGHPITTTRESTRLVRIGCRRMTIEEWIEKADVIGRAEQYSPATIAVYRGLLAAVRAWMDAALDAALDAEEKGEQG